MCAAWLVRLLLAIASDLTSLGTILSFIEEEDLGLVLPVRLWHADSPTQGFFISGRLLAAKSFHLDALSSSLKPTYSPIRGCFKDIDSDENDAVWGSSIRIRVAINMMKLLKRALKIQTVLGDEFIISFTYERLPNFCFLCGCLGTSLNNASYSFRTVSVIPGRTPPLVLGSELSLRQCLGQGMRVLAIV
ncbi:UNVERIFIED_CONTAM: hypothetical protein Scaly_1425200 [Sesamum calycinum]|uniref:Zinc knuckle CX2CX4HX4C domain-containing protein n=1 Tax=Sesamum calycinum TaxID=2727403 RepID=A0AAW2PMM3_9LAMI